MFPSPRNTGNADIYLGLMIGNGARYDYAIYHELIRTFEGPGFDAIDPAHPLVRELEGHQRANRQYFHLVDMVKLRLGFKSSTCRELFGLEPEDIHIATFLSRILPVDQKRFGLMRAKALHAAQELFMRPDGHVVQSGIYRQPDAKGETIPVLFQFCMCSFDADPVSVIGVLVLTDLSGTPVSNPALHHYLGKDLSFFRYPDEALLQEGLLFSKREMEILRLIAQRLESDQIAERLFLSVNTVNTHRRNILRKCGKNSTHELVIELQEIGVL